MAFAMGLVMLHHFHVVPLHHLEEVRRELRKIGHSWEARHVLWKALWVSWIALVKVLQMASAFLLCRLLSAEVLSVARTLQELCISLVLELLVDDDVVGYVVYVIGSIRSLAISLLVIRADVASSVALVWRLLPVSVQRRHSLHLLHCLLGRFVNIFLFFLLGRAKIGVSSDIHERLFVHVLELTHRVHVFLVVGIVCASSLNVIIVFGFLKIAAFEFVLFMHDLWKIVVFRVIFIESFALHQ